MSTHVSHPYPTYSQPGEQSSAVGNLVRASSAVPKNKAMRQAMVDGLVSNQAEFGNAAANPADPKPQRQNKRPKERVWLYIYIYDFIC